MSRNVKQELFDLIKSLSSTEKAYFIKYTKRFQASSTTDYVWLFNAINQQEKQDWSAIQQKMNPEKFKSGLSKVTQRLYDQLMRSMRTYSEDALITNKIHGLLMEAEFLLQKGLLIQFKHKVFKAKELAQKHQLPRFELLIFSKEWFLAYDYLHDLPFEKIQESELKLLQLIKKRVDLMNQCHDFYYSIEVYTENENLIDQKKMSRYLSFFKQIDSDLLPVRVQEKVLNAIFRYYFSVEQDYTQALNIQEQIMNFYRRSDHLPNQFPTDFLTVYFNLLLSYLMTSNYAGFQENIDLPEKLKFSKEWKIQLQVVQYPLLLHYYLSQQDLPNAKKIAAYEKKFQPVKFEGMWKDLVIYLNLMISFYHHLNGKYYRCTSIINSLLDNTNYLAKELVSICYFVLALSYHRLNDYRLLESTINKNKYFIRQSKKKYPQLIPIAQTLLDLIQSIANNAAKEVTREKYRAYNAIKGQGKNGDFLFFDIQLLLKDELGE